MDMTNYLIVDVYWYEVERGELFEHELTAVYIPPDPEAIRFVPEGVKITANQTIIFGEGDEVLRALQMFDEAGIDDLREAIVALSDETHASLVPLVPIMEFTLIETKIPVTPTYEIKPLGRQVRPDYQIVYNMPRRIVRDQYAGSGHGWIEIDDEFGYVVGMSYSIDPNVVEREQNMEMTAAAGMRVACDDVNQHKVIANFSCTQACLF